MITNIDLPQISITGSAHSLLFYSGSSERVGVVINFNGLYLVGTDADDSLVGLSGYDSIYGKAGDDDLDGGPGRDYLNGGYGSDTYRFGIGSGYDTIDNYAFSYYDTVGKSDRIVFGAGISPEDVVARRISSGDLVLTINGTRGDSLRVLHYFSGQDDYQVQQVVFDNGTIWDNATISILVTAGTSGDDYLVGTDANDTLTGLDGNDSIYGGAGDDDLDGGPGNDYLAGGYGSDTYRFGIGSGQDTINDYASSYDEAAGKIDRIVFGAGISPEDVVARRNDGNGYDLVLTINGATNDSLRILSYFSGQEDYQVQQVLFNDGTIWDNATIRIQVVTGTSGDDYFEGLNTNETLTGLGGNDAIYGGAGDDNLDGGADNDYLAGGYGSDTYRFGIGSGQDTINNYAPSIYEAAGKIDRIVFGNGISPEDVVARRIGYDLVLTINGAINDSLSILNYFSGQDDFQIQQIAFNNGTIWDTATIQSNFTTATPNDDSLIGTAADDTFNGLGGSDTVFFTGNRNEYDVLNIAGGYQVQDHAVGRDGTDTLSNVETMVFADCIVDLTMAQKAVTISAADLKTLEELYVGFFNRVPEASGLSFWIEAIENGHSLKEVADQFYAAGVQYGNYRADMSEEEFITQIYANVLGRSGATAPNSAEIGFWQEVLHWDNHNIVLDMIDIVHRDYADDPEWGWVNDLLNHKAEVADYFAVEQGLSYLNPQINIARGTQIASVITPTDTSAAISLIGVNDFAMSEASTGA